MLEFGSDFDSKNRRKARKKCNYSIGFRYVVKTVKKGDDNNTKSECESNFTSEIEKMKKMPKRLS